MAITRVVWEYEHITADGETIWIEEDDEVSASYKARKSVTGRIRSRTVTMKYTPWVIKQQDLIVDVEQ